MSLQLRQDMFNVFEGDFGENTYVLIEADILRNTLRTPVLLSALIQSSLTAMSMSSSIVIIMIGYYSKKGYCDNCNYWVWHFFFALTVDVDYQVSVCDTNLSTSGSGSGSSSGSGIDMSGSGSSSDSRDYIPPTPPSPFGSGFGSGFPTPNSIQIELIRGLQEVCLNVTIIGDITVEDEEQIFVLFLPTDPRINFIGSPSAQVNIIDNDGE